MIFFLKTKNSANQTQDSKQSKTSSMAQSGLSQSFGLVGGLRGMGAARKRHAGPPGPGRVL
ncbi:MAG TPA: hypothetical protein VJ184_00320 [Chryseolinea sp.]|nr:hypothetical protein [Chryseolinea sp.]